MIPQSVVSDWLVVSQERIDQFAEATDDRQWIHTDVARARTESPYGATVAHGFLTLSLIATLLRNSAKIEGVTFAVNYGLNKARFIAPVIAGSRVRGKFVAASIEERDQSTKVTWNVTVETGDGKPCCVAEWIVMYYK